MIRQQAPLNWAVAVCGLAVLINDSLADLTVKAFSFEQDEYEAVKSIDASSGTGWAINPNEENPNYIHYGMTNFVPGVVSIRMEFNFGTYHVPDKFTLSWSNDGAVTWHPITCYSSLQTQPGAAISVDEAGQVTTGAAATDRYTLTTSLEPITVCGK